VRSDDQGLAPREQLMDGGDASVDDLRLCRDAVRSSWTARGADGPRASFRFRPGCSAEWCRDLTMRKG